MRVGCFALLLCGGCSFATMSSPRGAVDQSQCDTGRAAPTVDATLAVGLGSLGYMALDSADDPCHEITCLGVNRLVGSVGAFTTALAAVHVASFATGLSWSSRCRELPPATLVLSPSGNATSAECAHWQRVVRSAATDEDRFAIVKQMPAECHGQ